MSRIVLTVLVIVVGITVGVVVGFRLRSPAIPRAEGPTSVYTTLLVAQEELATERDELRDQILDLQQKIQLAGDELKQQRTSRTQVEALEDHEDVQDVFTTADTIEN